MIQMKKDTGSQCKVDVCGAIRCKHNEDKRCQLDSVTIRPDATFQHFNTNKYKDWKWNLRGYKGAA